MLFILAKRVNAEQYCCVVLWDMFSFMASCFSKDSGREYGTFFYTHLEIAVSDLVSYYLSPSSQGLFFIVSLGIEAPGLDQNSSAWWVCTLK